MGRDYKGWSQVALFILYPFISEGMKHLLLCLTKVNILFLVDYLSTQTYVHAIACPAISDIHRRLYIENSCKVFDF